MKYVLKVQPAARADIQDAIKRYNRKQAGLGRSFHAEVKQQFEHLRISPFFQSRYDAVRCLPLKKFPFMVHFSIEEENKRVVIHAVFHTSLNPSIWKRKKD